MTTPTIVSAETTTIVLTRDELYILLSLLGVKALNGQIEAQGVPISAEEETIRRNCGEQMLQSRGLLTFEDERHIVLDDALVAIAGSAALPQATYMLQQVAPDGSRRAYYFSRGPDLLVEHTSPKAGIFEFRLIAGQVALQHRIHELTTELAECLGVSSGAMEQAKPESVAGFLAHSTASNFAGAEAALVGGGCSAKLAGDLVRAIKTYPHWLAVTGYADTNSRSVVSKTAMMLRDASCCWLLESDSDPSGRVSIHVLDGQSCRDTLVAMAQPLQAK